MVSGQSRRAGCRLARGGQRALRAGTSSFRGLTESPGGQARGLVT